MFPDTSVTIQRKSQTLYTGKLIQIDPLSLQESVQLGGESPFNSYNGFLLTPIKLDITLGDLLIDENEIDPKTGVNTRYRVAGEPNFYRYDQHMELYLQKVDGTPQ